MDTLLRPVIELTEGRDLVIVPGSGLYQVPWGSLPAAARAVAVAPSATAWVSASIRPAHTTGEDVVLVCGPGLPESVTELKRLRAIYPDAVVLDGQDATINAVLSRMDGARLVHIVAHGTHEPANALFSRVELGRRRAAGTRAGPAAQPPGTCRARLLRVGAEPHPARR